MYAKIRINGDILVKTGMHIGGSSAFASWKFFKRQNEEFTC